MRGKFVEYEWGELPQTLYFAWMAYSRMFNEFSRELANALNALTNYTHQLAAWRDLLAPLDSQQQVDAAVDFVDPLATVALNLPYVIRSRFIFASAHLCHQANRARQRTEWKDDFPLDRDVVFDAADKYGKGWKRYNAFKRCLEKLGAKDYQRDTQDFRNAYNHRFSPHIVLGVSHLVTRYVDRASGGVSYGFGEMPALTLPHVVTLLEVQCQLGYAAFAAFQALIREHESVIVPLNAECLEAIG